MGYLLGYENHFFLCSEKTTNDSLNNVCKAMVLSGYWITFLNINNFTTSLMSSLSNTLTQINERKENILINNEEYAFSFDKSNLFSYFGVMQSPNTLPMSTDAETDSLKITRINHEFNLVSKDLFEKFRVVKTTSEMNELESFLHSNLVVSGFETSTELCKQLLKLKILYQDILNAKNKNFSNKCICIKLLKLINIKQTKTYLEFRIG